MYANGTIVTLCAWQRSNSIVSRGSIKSDKVRLIETMAWYEMIWNGINKMIWNESKWHKMKWKDVKGYEQILTEPNICKGLFTRMIGVPVLMWQRQARATMTSIWGHFWSVYDLAWPKSSNDHSYMSCSINSIGHVEGTASCFDLWIKITQFWQSSLSPVLMSGHPALSRSKVRSKSLWPSSTCTIPGQYKKAN